MVITRAKKATGATVLTVSLLGAGAPWIAGVTRVVGFDHVLTGETWYRVCTEDTFGTCADSEHFTGLGPRPIRLLMRFRPGVRRITVSACTKDGCAMPVPVEVTVPIEWDF